MDTNSADSNSVPEQVQSVDNPSSSSEEHASFKEEDVPTELGSSNAEQHPSDQSEPVVQSMDTQEEEEANDEVPALETVEQITEEPIVEEPKPQETNIIEEPVHVPHEFTIQDVSSRQRTLEPVDQPIVEEPNENSVEEQNDGIVQPESDNNDVVEVGSEADIHPDDQQAEPTVQEKPVDLMDIDVEIPAESTETVQPAAQEVHNDNANEDANDMFNEEPIYQLDESVRPAEQQQQHEHPIDFVQPDFESSRIEKSGKASPRHLDVSNEDVEIVASFFQVDESLLRDPELLDRLLSKLGEYQDLKSKAQMIELNFEQYKHSITNKLDSARKLNLDSQAKITELTNAKMETIEEKEQAISELNDLRSSLQQNQKYVGDVKLKFQELSDSKRSAFDMLDRKQNQIIELNEELGRLSETNKTLRASLINSETKQQELGAETMKIKFQVAKLEQELKFTKDEADRYESELKSRTDQLISLREESRNRIVNLESELGKYKLNYNVAQSTNDKLSESIKDITTKHNQSLIQIKQLTDKSSLDQEKFAEEMARKDRLIQVLQRSSSDHQDRIDLLEKRDEETTEMVAKIKADSESQCALLKEELNDKDAKVRELENTITELTQSNFGDGQMMDTDDVLGSLGQQHILFSPSAQKTFKNMGSGSSISDVVAQYHIMKKELVKTKRSNSRLNEELKSIFKMLETKMPLLNSYKQRCEELEAQHSQMVAVIDSMNKEKSTSHSKFEMAGKKIEELQYQVRELDQYKIDLKRQVVVLLSQVTFKNEGQPLLTREEKHYIAELVKSSENSTDNTDTGKLITERLTTFRNIKELIDNNENLLIVSRNLGNELERGESNGKSHSGDDGDEDDEDSIAAVAEAQKAVEKLKDKLQQTETQLKAATNSRDMLQKMITDGSVQVPSNQLLQQQERQQQTGFVSSDELFKVTQDLRSKQQELYTFKKESGTTIQKLNSDIQQLNSKNSQISLELARAKSSVQLLQQQADSTQHMLNIAKSESKELKSHVEKLQSNLSKIELKSQALADDLLHARTGQAEFEVKYRGLLSEKTMWKSVEERLRSEINTLIDEKAKLNIMIGRLQSLGDERSNNDKDTLHRLTQTIDSLQKELDNARAKVDATNEEVKRILHSKNYDSQLYQKRIDSLSQELNAARESLIVKSNAIDTQTTQLKSLQKKYDEATNRKSSAMAVMSAATDSADDVVLLKQELTNTLEDLELATQNANQFKEIADATEKELGIINETYAKFKESSESKLLKVTEEYDALKLQVDDLTEVKLKLQDELDKTTADFGAKEEEYQSKVSELNNSIEAFDAIKSDYENRLQVVKDELSSKEEFVKNCQSELEAKISELYDVSNSQSQLRDEYNLLQEKTQRLEVELDNTKSSLVTAEDNWNSHRYSLEEEMKTSKIRNLELEAQNRTLMNQLESSPFSFNVSDAENASSDMKNLITYLHREKDSVSQQLEYSKTEEKKLRQALTRTQDELTEVKTELIKAKDKAESASKFTSLFTEMKEKIHELELYKDNNRILREENASYGERIEDLEQQLLQMTEQLQPLQQELNQLNGELQVKETQIQLSNSQIEFWKKRSEDLLHGKEATNEQESNLISEIDELKSQITKLQESEKTIGEKYEKLKLEAQDKLNKSKATRSKMAAEREALAAEVKKLQEQLNNSNKNSNPDESTAEAQNKIASLEKQLGDVNSALGRTRAENVKLKLEYTASVDKLKQEIESLNTQVTKLTEDLKNASASPSSVEGMISSNDHESEISKLKEQFASEMESALKSKEEELKASSNSGTGVPMTSEELEKAKEQIRTEVEAKFAQELAEHKKKLRAPTQAKINEVIEQRWKARTAELDKQYETKLSDLESKYANNKADEDSSSGLKESFEKEKEELFKKFEQEKEQLKKDTSAAVRKETEFRENILKKQLALLKEKVKQLQAKVGDSSTPASASASASTPSSAPVSASVPAPLPAEAAAPTPTTDAPSTSASNGTPAIASLPQVPKLPAKPTQETAGNLKRSADEDTSNGKRNKTD